MLSQISIGGQGGRLTDEGLDWAFCDTDSMAFANSNGIALDEFEKRVRKVCTWFEPLNPYEQRGSILEFEDQNFSVDGPRRLEPLYCAAISAKRYALFNLDSVGEPVIRKASAHGLGHLLPPYSDEGKDERESGVRQWHEDVWKAIIKSLRSPNPLEVRIDWREELSHPAVSQYTAATPDRLDWFKDFNRDKPYIKQVKPFNFLLQFYGKRPDEMARDGLLTTSDGVQKQPTPVAPYSRKPYFMLSRAWDAASGKPVERRWLRSYAEALRAYHLHPETKFLHGEATDCGPTFRRHVFVETIEDIGKEADRWDDEAPIAAEDEFTVSYGISETDREKMLAVIQSVSKRQLARTAHVSTRTIPETLDEANEMSEQEFRRLFSEASALVEEKEEFAEAEERLVRWVVQQVDECGLKSLADALNYDPANLVKVVAGRRKISSLLRKRIVENIMAKGIDPH